MHGTTVSVCKRGCEHSCSCVIPGCRWLHHGNALCDYSAAVRKPLENCDCIWSDMIIQQDLI